MHKRHLPIASPCHEDWDRMDPVERGRFCHSCEKQVFDLSSMTEQQAKGVLHECGGQNICVRYRYDEQSGRLRFRPERVGQAAALALSLAACAPHDNPDVPVIEHDATEQRTEPVIPTLDEPCPTEPVTMGEPMPVEVKGDVAVPEPPKPEPTPVEVKGDVAVPEPPAVDEEPKPRAVRHVKGRMPIDHEILGNL